MRNRKRGDNGDKKTAPKPMPKIEEEMALALGPFLSKLDAERARGEAPEKFQALRADASPIIDATRAGGPPPIIRLFLEDFFGRDRREIMERDLEASLELLQAEGNPVLMWAMWWHCRREGLPVPKEVIDYLDKVAVGILALTSSPPGKLAPELQKVLGFQAGVGRGSDISRYSDAERDLEIAANVASLLHSSKVEGKRLSQTKAFALVAEDWTKRGWKISVETVGRAWRRHRLPQPKAETNGDGGSA
jgi:hypothetical protein